MIILGLVLLLCVLIVYGAFLIHWILGTIVLIGIILAICGEIL